jgi:hypothetical protein
LAENQWPRPNDAKIPRFPAAYLEMDRGIGICAQHTPKISNELQKQVESHVVKMFPSDERNGLKKYGVTYHKQIAGGKHIWMVRALNEERYKKWWRRRSLG